MVNGKISYSLPWHGSILPEAAPDVYDALVCTAPERQVLVAQRLYEGPVNEYVYLLNQVPEAFLPQCLLEEVARVAPDCLPRPAPDAPGQFGEGFCLIERVAAGEGDVGKGIPFDFLHQVVHAAFLSTPEVPRLGVVAPGAMMAASRTVDTGAETRAIDGCVVKDREHSNCHG